MINEDDSLKEKLLHSDSKMDKTVIENETDGEEGDLRLHDAVCDSDNIEEIETLVSEEPQLVFETDSEQNTPLHTLVTTGDELTVDIAKILLGVVEEDESLIRIERPEALNLQNYRKFTALHYAAQGRQVELVEAFLRWGADPTIQDKDGNTPLHVVAESRTEKAVKVAELLVNHHEGKTLINTVNHQEHTPLHRAIEKRCLNMVNFLLLPHVKFNLSFKAKSNGRGVLHFAATVSDESDTACQVTRSILQRCTKPQVDMQDNKGKTALHVAAIKRYPKVARVLVEDERTSLLTLDDEDRTALHYAAEDGCYTQGYECVEVLVDGTGKLKTYSEQVNYLFKMKDKKKQTAFMYACINCPADTMKKFVECVPHPQEWLDSTHMTLLYKNCPLAIPSLMNNAFQEEDKIIECKGTIRTDFGLISGYKDPVENLPQQESRYLKEALWWDFKAQREVLLHPLSQFFITLKWQKLRWIIAVWIVWQLIWLAAYTSLALSFYRATVSSPALAVVASLVMIVYLLGSLLNEIFEIFTIGFAYFLSLTNSLQLLQDVLGFIAITPVLLNYGEPVNWMKYTTAVGVLLAYILSMRDIGKLNSKIGLIVEVLKQVLIQIVQVLLCCSPLWIGFTVAFLIIFSDEDSLNSSFPGPIVKVFVMMTGEFEYNDTFNKEANGENGPKEVSAAVSSIKLLFFLAFLISVPVGFFNLLTGFALDKVMELRERAKVARIAKQLEHIYFIDSIFLRLRPLSKILSHKAMIAFLRRFNVTSMWIDGELKFETLFWEKMRKSEGNFQPRGFRGTFFSRKKLGIWRTDLPSDVLEEIYALASPKSQPERSASE